MMRYLLALLSLFLIAEVSATHLVGGSLNYEYLGQNTDGTYRYRIYSVTYTDVGPTSNFDDPEPDIPVGIYEENPDDPDGDKTLFATMSLFQKRRLLLRLGRGRLDVG